MISVIEIEELKNSVKEKENIYQKKNFFSKFFSQFFLITKFFNHIIQKMFHFGFV